MKNVKVVRMALVLTLTALTLQGCNAYNTIGDSSKVEDAQLWFEDTGVVVKDPVDRVYHIVKDKNGYLYYCCQGESAVLEKVLDENGNSTKDISIFE